MSRRRPLVLRVDPITCDGHGLCADLLPELIELDDWGYPILHGVEVPPELETEARRAQSACPKLALHLSRRKRSDERTPGKVNVVSQAPAARATPRP